MGVLVAGRAHASGCSTRDSFIWQPSTKVISVLDAAFYTASGAVMPSGRRAMPAPGVSGSMCSHITDLLITACEASAALALV